MRFRSMTTENGVASCRVGIDHYMLLRGERIQHRNSRFSGLISTNDKLEPFIQCYVLASREIA